MTKPKAKQDTLKQLRADMEARFAEILAGKTAVVVGVTSFAGVSPVIDNRKPTSGYIQQVAHPDGSVTLEDGTKQFQNAPTGSVGATGPATTPALPKEYGVGAVVSFQGSPYHIIRTGEGLFYILFQDSEGLRELALYPYNVTLVTAAP